MHLKDIRERQAKLVADARTILDQITDDTPEARAKELEEQHDKHMAEYDRLEERAKRAEALAEREKSLDEPDPRRPIGEPRRNETPEDTLTHNQVFRSYLINGLDGMQPEERAALKQFRAQSTADSAGGYTIPKELMNELIVSLKAWGPMLDPGVTREIVTASGNQISWPTLNDTANQAYRLAENTAATNEGDLVFGQKQLDAYKYASGPILVSSELLQDSAFNVEGIIRDAMAQRFGRKVNADLTVGDGSGDPNGIVTASTAGFTAASAAAVSFDDLIELAHSIDPAYRTAPSVRFMFNDSTLKLLRKIKDLEGRYVWQPADARTGQPASILSYAYVVNQAMADVATAAKSVLFGDFNKYIVRRVREVSIRRLIERYAEFDQVAFIAFARYDGDLMDTAAVKHLVHP